MFLHRRAFKVSETIRSGDRDPRLPCELRNDFPRPQLIQTIMSSTTAGLLALSLVAAMNAPRLHGQEEWSLRIAKMGPGPYGTELILETKPGQLYEVESSTDLRSWRPVEDSELSTGGSMRVILGEAPGSTRFYRAQVIEDPDLLTQLGLARDRWAQIDLQDYEYEFQWSCHCVPDFTQWVTITVRAGAIAAIKASASNEPIPVDRWGDYHTIEGLFDWIDERIRREPARIDVTFNPDWGHPDMGSVDESLQIADEEIAFRTAGLPSVRVEGMLQSELRPADAVIEDGFENPVRWTGRRDGDSVILSRTGLIGDESSFHHELRLRRPESPGLPVFLSARETDTHLCCDPGEGPTIEIRRMNRGRVTIQDWDPNGVVSGRVSGDFEWVFWVDLDELPEVAIATEVPPGIDPLWIRSAGVVNQVLELDLEYSGGCHDDHEVTVTMAPDVFAESFPVQADLHIRHNANGDACEAILRKIWRFDLAPVTRRHQAFYDGDDPIILRLRTSPDDPGIGLPVPTRVTHHTAPVRSLNAGEQDWIGGVEGSGHGTDYRFLVKLIGNGDYEWSAIWIDDRMFNPRAEIWVDRGLAGPSAGDLVELSAQFTVTPLIDPENPEIPSDEFNEDPPRSGDGPRFNGAALIRYRYNGVARDLEIPVLTEYEPVAFP